MSLWLMTLILGATVLLAYGLRVLTFASHRREFLPFRFRFRFLLERSPLARPRPRRGEPTHEQASRLSARLERLMQEQRPWLEDDLRLGDLAAALGTSRHQLSRVLNRHLATSFHEYVNRHRVAEARRLLADPERSGNVMAAGFAAGFGSQATFYRAFRRFVGETPKAFASRHCGVGPLGRTC